MTHVSVGDHLAAMTEEKPLFWLIELGQMLQEIDAIDNALAASLAFDLSRNPTMAKALKELIDGYQIIKEELGKNSLTTIQDQTVRRVLNKIGINLDQLSNSSFSSLLEL
jgi:hypothetical protein